jgi:hypothetical protein
MNARHNQTDIKIAMALRFAAQGFRIFLIPANSKIPAAGTEWKKDASADPETIKTWFEDDPRANYIVAPDESHFVTDLDVKDGRDGFRDLESLEALNTDLPDTLVVKTPSGGAHFYWTGTAPLSVGKKTLGGGIDIRGNCNGRAGYVIGPGSLIDGKAYEVIADHPIAAAPDWLVKLCAQPTREVRTAASDVELNTAANIQRGQRHIRDLVKQGRVAIEGRGGNNFTFAVACALRDLGVVGEAAFELMRDEFNPHCRPQWDLGELAAIIEHAGEYAQNTPGSDAGRPAAETFKDYVPAPQAVKEAQDAPPFLMDYAGLMALPDPEPLVRGYIAIGDHAELRGYLKSAKTFIALDVALSIAAGVPALGHIETCQQGPVVYLAGEGFHVIKPRVRAWLRARGIAPERIAHTFFCKPAVPLSAKGVDECELYIKGIKATLKCDPVLIVIDTMSNSLGAEDENSPAAANLYSEMVKRMRRDLRCTALTVAHTGKDAERGTRGSSAFEANADAILESVYDKDTRIAEFKFINGRLGGDMTSNFYRLSNVPEAGSKDYVPAVLIATEKPSAKPVEADKWKATRRLIIETLGEYKCRDTSHYLTTRMLADALASSGFDGKEPRESDEEAHGRWEKQRNDWLATLKNGVYRGRLDGLWENVPVAGTTSNQRHWFLPPELAEVDPSGAQ